MMDLPHDSYWVHLTRVTASGKRHSIGWKITYEEYKKLKNIKKC